MAVTLTIYLAVAVVLQRRQEDSSSLYAGLIPVTVPELLRLLRDIVIPPPPGGTGPTGCTGRPGGAAISTAPAKPTSVGMLMQRQLHDHNELQLPSQRGERDPGRGGRSSKPTGG